jgi:hypothetical protein
VLFHRSIIAHPILAQASPGLEAAGLPLLARIRPPPVAFFGRCSRYSKPKLHLVLTRKGTHQRGRSMQESSLSQKSAASRGFWAQHREASLNWLALGLLLAAWNSVDNDPSPTARRPDKLRGYVYVSVRAATRSAAIDR